MTKQPVWFLMLWITVVWLFTEQTVWAWGDVGHQVIATIAERHLTPVACQQIQPLIPLALPGARSLADIATQADRYRKHHPETSGWHYINLKSGGHGYDPDRDCPDTKRGYCIVRAIEAQERIIRESQNDTERAQALMFLTHLLGDLNQPLHTSDRNDRGGNDVKIRFPRSGSRNLHAAWDSGMIHRLYRERGWVDGDTDALALWLVERYGTVDTVALAKGTVVDWMLETHQVANKNAYGPLPKYNDKGVYYLSHRYYQHNRPIVEHRLWIAGIRLASILNELFR